MVEIDGVYFGRTPDGCVRVLRLRSVPLSPPAVTSEFLSSEKLVDITIPPGSWASMVADVSAVGATPPRYYTALAFHSDLK